MLFIILFILILVIYEYNHILHQTILSLLGFKINMESFTNLPSQIIFIGAHTSVYDFFIGSLLYYGYFHKKYNNYILMKEDFEKYTSSIFYHFDSKLKFIPVHKEKKGLIRKIVDELRFKDNYVLFISPEGTRKRTETIKTGYWTLANELNIDVVYVGIDFFKKTIVFEEPRKVEKYWENEKEKFIISTKKYSPLFPENCSFSN